MAIFLWERGGAGQGITTTQTSVASYGTAPPESTATQWRGVGSGPEINGSSGAFIGLIVGIAFFALASLFVGFFIYNRIRRRRQSARSQADPFSDAYGYSDPYAEEMEMGPTSSHLGLGVISTEGSSSGGGGGGRGGAQFASIGKGLRPGAVGSNSRAWSSEWEVPRSPEHHMGGTSRQYESVPLTGEGDAGEEVAYADSRGMGEASQGGSGSEVRYTQRRTSQRSRRDDENTTEGDEEEDDDEESQEYGAREGATRFVERFGS